jgi:hypothetical protein
MKTFADTVKTTEVRRRAARVRKRWTVNERRRRLGLPPDAPRLLREYLLGCPTQVWPLAGCDSR